MNKYIVPICYINKSLNKLEVINARSYHDCQEQIMEKIIMDNDLPETDNYKQFLTIADEHDIIIGKISDVEEL